MARALRQRQQFGPRRKVLEHAVFRAIAQLPYLVRVAVCVALADGRAAAGDEQVVQHHHLRARLERRVQGGKEIAPTRNRNVG
ncbi:MAG TPA: hypothetical protein VMF03_05195 [Steroidobacteraceae bacterium]|nr:hypothetical protein [Steroidobacteraceae bacterium]